MPMTQTNYPVTESAIRVGGALMQIDVGALRREIATKRQSMTQSGWPEPHINCESDEDLADAIEAFQRHTLAGPKHAAAQRQREAR